MDIGDPIKTHRIEPARSPIPERVPAEPKRQPLPNPAPKEPADPEPKREPTKVPVK